MTIPRDTADGTIIYTSEQQSIRYVEFTCTTDSLLGYVVDPSRGKQPQSGNEFPLGTSGLAAKIAYMGVAELRNAGDYVAPAKVFTLTIIKRGNLSSLGTIKPGKLGQYVFGEAVVLDFNLNNPINIVAASCETPNIAVEMGNYTPSDFGSSGNTTQPVNFNITLNNCPAGIIKKVNYTLKETTPPINASQGIVSLNTSSTAKGVALQLRDGSGNPIPLNTAQNFTDYDSKGGNFQIPMSASYYRLPSESLRPGTADTEVIFTMNYL
ncbi:fimbrial protein [Pseudomonas sp. ZS1P83]